MALEVDIHEAQTEILRTLLFATDASFSELCKRTGFSSDHFNFHVKKLVNLGLVEKTDKGSYALTIKGKEYSNRLDTDDRTIEKQPKSGILIVPTRKNEAGQDEFLVQRRLKQPFFGYLMCMTGKIRWGETLFETAERELLEETNLRAKKFEMRTIYHKLDYAEESGELLEDKIFYCCVATDLSGDNFETFEGGENHWMTIKDFQAADKTLIEVDDFNQWFYDTKLRIREKKYFYPQSEY